MIQIEVSCNYYSTSYSHLMPKPHREHQCWCHDTTPHTCHRKSSFPPLAFYTCNTPLLLLPSSKLSPAFFLLKGRASSAHSQSIGGGAASLSLNKTLALLAVVHFKLPWQRQWQIVHNQQGLVASGETKSNEYSEYNYML